MTKKAKLMIGAAGVLVAAAAVILYSEKKSDYKMTKRIKKAGKQLKGNVEKAARQLKDKYETVKDDSASHLNTFTEKKFPATMQ